MITEVIKPSAERTAAFRLIRQIRTHKFHVLVRCWNFSNKYHGFAFLITDHGRQELRLQTFGFLIEQGAVRVRHVFADGQILYEAAP